MKCREAMHIHIGQRINLVALGWTMVSLKMCLHKNLFTQIIQSMGTFDSYETNIFDFFQSSVYFGAFTARRMSNHFKNYDYLKFCCLLALKLGNMLKICLVFVKSSWL